MATITQRIELQGGDDAKRQLLDLLNAGKSVFSGLQDAAQKGGDLARALNSEAAQKQLGALAAASRGLQNTLQDVGQTAQQTGSNLRGVGDSAQGASRQAQSGASQFAAVGKTLAAAAVGAVALGAALFAAAKQAATGAKDIGDAATDSGASLDGFQKAKFIFEQMGLSSKEATSLVGTLVEKTKDGTAAIADRLTQLGFRFANTKDGIAAAKQMIEQFGGSNIALDPLLQKLKQVGIVIPTGPDQTKTAVDLGARLGLSGGTLDKIKDETPDVVAQIRSLADTIALMGDEAAQKKAAVAALGDDLGEKLVDELKKGSAGVNEFISDYNRLALGVKQGSVDLAENYSKAMARFTSASETARVEFGQTFLPVVTEGVRQFTNLMRLNKPALEEFAASVAAQVRQLAADFVSLFQSNGDAIKTGWLKDLRDIVAGIVLPALRGVADLAQQAVDKINALFGTNFSASGAGIAAAIVFLIGGFNSLLLVVTALFAGASPLLDRFRAGLLSIGIDVEEIKTKIIALWNGLKSEIGKIDWKALLGDISAQDIVATIVGLVAAFLLLRRAAITLAPFISRILGKQVSGDALIFYGILGQITGLTNSFITLLVGAAAGTTLLVNALRLIGFVLTPLIALLAAFFGIPAAVLGGAIAIVAALGVAIYLFWNDIKAAAISAWQAIEEKASSTWDAIVARVAQAWEAIKDFFSADTFAAIWEAIKTSAESVWGSIVAAVSGFIGQIVSAAEGAAASILNALTSPFESAQTIIGGIIATISSWIDGIVSAANAAASVLQSLNPFGSAADAGSSLGADSAGFAGGGDVRGAGTSTSDSILAWLSNGEFVQPTRRVLQYGRDFMEAIRQGALPVSLVRSLMTNLRGFTGGGFVQRMGVNFVGLPRFAEGGLAAAGIAAAPSSLALAPVHFHFGGRQVGGFFGTGDAIGQLRAHMADELLTSAGPAPSWAR